MRATEVTCVKFHGKTQHFWVLLDTRHAKKQAAGHILRQNIITLAPTVMHAILNMRLGALLKQQLLREGCFPEMIMQRGLEPLSNDSDNKKRDTGDATQYPSEM